MNDNILRALATAAQAAQVGSPPTALVPQAQAQPYGRLFNPPVLQVNPTAMAQMQQAQKLADLKSRFDAMVAYVSAQNPYFGQAGSAGARDAYSGISYARTDGNLYKGGFVSSDPADLTAAQIIAGVTLNIPFNADAIARMTNTNLCQLSLAGGIDDGSAIEEIANAPCSLKINGSPVPQLHRIPLQFLVAKTFSSFQSWAQVNTFVPDNANVSLEIAIDAAPAYGGGDTTITLYGLSGDRCTQLTQNWQPPQIPTRGF